MDLKRSHTSIGIRKVNINNFASAETPKTFSRSATAFDLKRHYAVKSLYTNSSTLYVKKKFNFRSATALNRQLNPIERLKTPLDHLNTVTSPYPHLEDDRPKRSLLTLARIGILYFGIELLFSLETALTVPILLQLKVPENVYSLVWVISPLLGVVMQPILGIMSDRCQSRFGRRRPFITVLGLGAFLGIALILNSIKIGEWLGDKPELRTPIYSILLTGVGVTFLDFCADSSDSPLRAFLLDVCNVEDQDTGLNIHAILGGFGSAFGFILAGINWKKTFFNKIGDEFLILFIFASVIFFVTLLLTLTSVKEERFYLDGNNDEKLPLFSDSKTLITSIPDDENNYISLSREKKGLNKENSESTENSYIEDDDDDDDDDNDNEIDKPITVKLLLKSTLYMPKELFFVMICQLIGWSSTFSLSFFLTDFVGQGIYHGDPFAGIDTISYENYNNGVKMGCWCLLTTAISSSIYAFILEKILLEKFSTKLLFFIGCLLNAILTSCIFFTSNIYIIMILCSGVGILITTLSTLPYQILSEFHSDDNYRRKSPEGTKRGIGVDCSLLSACFFLAQTIVATYSSPLINYFGNYTIVVTCSILSFLNCFWIALFMIFPKKEQN